MAARCGVCANSGATKSLASSSEDVSATSASRASSPNPATRRACSSGECLDVADVVEHDEAAADRRQHSHPAALHLGGAPSLVDRIAPNLEHIMEGSPTVTWAASSSPSALGAVLAFV